MKVFSSGSQVISIKGVILTIREMGMVKCIGTMDHLTKVNGIKANNMV